MNPYWRDIEFEDGENVFLKATPRIGVTRLRVKGMLPPRYIGPFRILERIGKVAYCLSLPPLLGHVYNIFHISILRKYIPYSSPFIQ